MIIGMPQHLRPLLNMTNDEWENLCLECGGWEWIDSEAKGKNEFGENVGLERLRETLEANEWDGGNLDVEDNMDVFETELGLRDESPVSRAIEAETDAPGMHEAILKQDEDGNEDPGGDDQIEELESMMLKIQAIKGVYLNPIFVLFDAVPYLHQRQLIPFPLAEKGAGMAPNDRKRFAARAVMEVMKSTEAID